MRADQRLAGQLVERAGQPLGEAPAVDEDQRRAVRADQLEQPRVDRRPDRRARRALRRRAARDLVRLRRAAPCPRPALRSRSSSCFFSRGVDDRDRAVRRRPRGPAANSSWIASSGVRRLAAARLAPADPALRRGSRARRGRGRRRRRGTARPRRAAAASPRGRCAGAAAPAERLEPLERQRQVRAALGRHQRVDLVDDDRVDRRAAPRARSTSAAGTATRAW